jgi:hypothetical protein
LDKSEAPTINMKDDFDFEQSKIGTDMSEEKEEHAF